MLSLISLLTITGAPIAILASRLELTFEEVRPRIEAIARAMLIAMPVVSLLSVAYPQNGSKCSSAFLKRSGSTEALVCPRYYLQPSVTI